MVEMAFPECRYRGTLSHEEIERRIQECHALLGETDELDFKDTRVEGPSDATKVLESSIRTLQQLGETVRLSRSPVVAISHASETASTKQQEAVAEVADKEGSLVAT